MRRTSRKIANHQAHTLTDRHGTLMVRPDFGLTSVTGQRRHVARYKHASQCGPHFHACSRAMRKSRRVYPSVLRAARCLPLPRRLQYCRSMAPARAFDSANTRRPWRVSVVGLRLLARHRAGVGAGLPLRLPLRDPLHRAHAHRPALQLGALRLLLAGVVFALVPRVVVPGKRDTRRRRE